MSYMEIQNRQIQPSLPRNQVLKLLVQANCKCSQIQVSRPTFSRKRNIVHFAKMSRCWDFWDPWTIKKGKVKIGNPDSVALAWKLLCFNGSLIVRLWTFRSRRIFTTLLHILSSRKANMKQILAVILNIWEFGVILNRSNQLVLLLKLPNSYNSILYIIILDFCTFPSKTKYCGTWVCGLVFCRLPGQFISIWHQL